MFGGYIVLLKKFFKGIFCLDPCFTGCLVGTKLYGPYKQGRVNCLDPCFTGCLVGTAAMPIPMAAVKTCLDPCFTGCLVGTKNRKRRD